MCRVKWTTASPVGPSWAAAAEGAEGTGAASGIFTLENQREHAVAGCLDVQNV